MAIQPLYMVVCDYVIQSTDGKVTAAGIFHNVEVDAFPAAKSPLGIVVAFRGDAGDAFELALEAPDGQLLWKQAGAVERPPNLREHQQWAVQSVVVWAPAVFGVSGVYRVVLRGDRGEVTSYPFGVLQRRVPEQEANDGASA